MALPPARPRTTAVTTMSVYPGSGRGRTAPAVADGPSDGVPGRGRERCPPAVRPENVGDGRARGERTGRRHRPCAPTGGWHRFHEREKPGRAPPAGPSTRQVVLDEPGGDNARRRPPTRTPVCDGRSTVPAGFVRAIAGARRGVGAGRALRVPDQRIGSTPGEDHGEFVRLDVAVPGPGHHLTADPPRADRHLFARGRAALSPGAAGRIRPPRRIRPRLPLLPDPFRRVLPVRGVGGAGARAALERGGDPKAGGTPTW